MYTRQTKQEVKNLIKQKLEQESGTPVSSLAEELNLTEGAITFALPDNQVSAADGQHTEAILTELPSWGKVTTIVHSCGSIFEFKNPFPKGKVGYGYYNIMGKEGLHGHLNISAINHIAFVSKPFRDMESHYIGFFTELGECVFKVYVGRDKARSLFPEQIAAFRKMKQQYC
ncbi:heme utilization cystosolic carrier protein HutX [Vibrio sp. SS-MA-C1-2]|uniref:heme utilization cystosolic carrier protein HutX n=1 Tax=Vibrio sp. SS-MA-C1-2 TaxID=2908646 RepID=UPI001F1A15C2|nr:heme utilization cystosolic carrier protein HutX [Vibrio sp. SS-MA-C1-2]UJF17337.1 heme utilization cystosolic carrier protein HutX [Vibrio sp. SS-MA-C1-2]